MDVPPFALWELLLLGIRGTRCPGHPEAPAPQAQTESLLRARQIQLVDIHRMKVPVSIRLTAIATPVIEAHHRTLLWGAN